MTYPIIDANGFKRNFAAQGDGSESNPFHTIPLTVWEAAVHENTACVYYYEGQPAGGATHVCYFTPPAGSAIYCYAFSISTNINTTTMVFGEGGSYTGGDSVTPHPCGNSTSISMPFFQGIASVTEVEAPSKRGTVYFGKGCYNTNVHYTTLLRLRPAHTYCVKITNTTAATGQITGSFYFMGA